MKRDHHPDATALDRHDLWERLEATMADAGRRRIRTPYGTVHDGGRRITGNERELYLWATRPPKPWPCSTLRHDSGGVSCGLDRGGELVAFATRRQPEPWIDGTELDAWLCDVLALALDILALTLEVTP